MTDHKRIIGTDGELIEPLIIPEKRKRLPPSSRRVVPRMLVLTGLLVIVLCIAGVMLMRQARPQPPALEPVVVQPVVVIATRASAATYTSTPEVPATATRVPATRVNTVRPEITTTPVPAAEIMVIPFNKLASTFSSRKYSGKVTLTISGTGQAGGNSYSDAFYLYTNEDGSPRVPPLTEMFDLEIDRQRAILALGLSDHPPAYSTEHTYRVLYDVGNTPRQIAFRISDSTVSDNRGVFTVQIAQ